MVERTEVRKGPLQGKAANPNVAKTCDTDERYTDQDPVVFSGLVSFFYFFFSVMLTKLMRLLLIKWQSSSSA